MILLHMFDFIKNPVLTTRGVCVALLLIMFFPLSPLSSRSAEIPEKSRERINNIIKIIKRFQVEYSNLNDPDVKKTLMEEVGELVTLAPDSEIKSMGKDDLTNQIRRKVALKFPDKHTEFVEKVNAEAEDKFKPAKINEFVSVKYKKGNNIFSQDGVFWSFGIGSKSVKIGNSNISIIDLFDEDRVKFDEAFNKQKKKEFINSKIENYYKIKQNYSNDVHNDLIKQINDQNENNGYIYWKKWWTAKDLTQKLIDDEMNGTKPSPDDTAGKPEEPPTKPVTPDKPVDPEVTSGTGQKAKDLTKKAEDEWVRIKNTFPGIDADQGYRPALWYMKSNDVDILLAKELGSKTGDVKVIKMTGPGAIDCIELHFFHEYFYKVVTKYKIAKTAEAMYQIARKIKDIYGATDQEKEAEIAEENSEKPAEEKPADGKPAGDAPPVEAPLPPEETFTWTGKITKGTLYFKRNPDGSLASMTFTKENPKVVEEINKKLEEDRKKREKEEKEKELEDYKKFNN